MHCQGHRMIPKNNIHSGLEKKRRALKIRLFVNAPPHNNNLLLKLKSKRIHYVSYLTKKKTLTIIIVNNQENE